jgi:hypothetical protein
MKKYNIILPFLTAIIVISCNKDEEKFTFDENEESNYSALLTFSS